MAVLPTPGLADEDRVVLRPPGEDLHDPLDLPGATDDGVELALPGRLGEVAAELVEDGRTLGSRLPPGRGGRPAELLLGSLRTGEELDDGLAHLLELSTHLLEDLGGDAFALPDEAEEDVLGADVVVPELERLAEAQLEDLLGPGSEGDVAGRGLLALPDDLDDLLADSGEADPEALERLGGDPLALVEETEKDVLGPDVVVVEEARPLPGPGRRPDEPDP